MKENPSIEKMRALTPYRFRRQWLLSDSAPKAKFHLKERQVNKSLTLFYHVDCQISEAQLNDFKAIVIGIAVNEISGRQDLENALLIAFVAGTSLTQALIPYAGSYVAIVSVGQDVSVMNDPAGFYGIYHDNSRAASTPALLVESKDLLLEKPIFTLKHKLEWYTGSYTPYNANIKKLIPNHVLSLPNGRSHRFWPDPNISGLSSGGEDKNLIVLEMAHVFRTITKSVAETNECIGSITGGYDSRIVAAALAAVSDKTNLFTIIGGGVAREDERIAAQVASALIHDGCRYMQIPFVEPSAEILSLYDEIAAGESIGSRRAIVGSVSQLMAGARVHVNGNLGALLKSYYQPTNSSAEVSPSFLAKDFQSKPDFIKAGIIEWLATAERYPPSTVYELFYLEQRGGRWMAAGENASRIFFESFSPFNCRRIFDLASKLNRADRLSGHILKLLAEEFSAGISSISYTGSRRRFTKYIPEFLKGLVRPIFKR